MEHPLLLKSYSSTDKLIELLCTLVNNDIVFHVILFRGVEMLHVVTMDLKLHSNTS